MPINKFKTLTDDNGKNIIYFLSKLNMYSNEEFIAPIRFWDLTNDVEIVEDNQFLPDMITTILDSSYAEVLYAEKLKYENEDYIALYSKNSNFCKVLIKEKYFEFIKFYLENKNPEYNIIIKDYDNPIVLRYGLKHIAYLLPEKKATQEVILNNYIEEYDET